MTSYGCVKVYVNSNLLLKCNTSVDEMNISDNIYGEKTPILQGKMRINKPTVHTKIEKIPLPIPISERQKYLHLYMEFVFINI